MTAYRPLARHGLAVIALLLASAAGAEETVITLSPAAKEKLLDAAAMRNAKAADEARVNGVGRQIHGEVGMMIGTHGTRGLFGSAVAPIGESGTIAVAFENSRFGGLR